MNIETTKALVPVQGVIQPIITIENKGIDHYNGYNRHKGRIISVGYRPNRVHSTYGARGKEVENHVVVGGNIDIYV